MPDTRWTLRAGLGLLVAGLLVCLLVATTAGPAAAARPRRAEPPATPLQVTMTSITPSTLVRGQPVRISGTVTNVTDDTWTDVKVFPVLSAAAFTTAEEVAAAAATAAADVIGSRSLDPRGFADVGDLAPRQSAPYTVSIDPRRLPDGLSAFDAPGVHWVGAHALGVGPDGYDSVADGRARTFIPYVFSPARPPRGADVASTEVSLVAPVQARVARGAGGEILDPDRWERLLAAEGRLGRLLRLLDGAGPRVTWVVDPAVLDAVAEVAAGSPRLSLEPDGSASGEQPPTGPVPPVTAGEGADAAAVAAAAWLGSWLEAAEEVRMTPYGDPDVSSLARFERRLFYDLTTELSEDAAARYGLDAALVLAPPQGQIAPLALETGGPVDPRTPVLLSERVLPPTDGVAFPTAAGGQPLLTTSQAVVRGGPEPGGDRSPLGLRQRILAEAAVRALAESGDPSAEPVPLVAVLPERWDPGPVEEADFVAGLDVPWLRLVPLPTTGSVLPRPAVRPSYSPAQRRAELPVANLDAAALLAEAGRTLDELLPRTESVRLDVARDATAAVSHQQRRLAATAAARAASQRRQIQGTLRRVRIEVPDLVTMSSGEGNITLKVVNDLDQPVELTLVAQVRSGGSDPSLEITEPEPLTLPAGQRSTLRLPTRASRVGVNEVALVPVTASGRPLGEAESLNVRATNVGTTIWVVMGGAGGLLMIVVVLRVVRRIRERRATHGPLLAQTGRPA